MRDREERTIGMESLWRQFDRLVVFDTETTGIEFGQDEIIELGAAAFSPAGETGSMDLLIRLTPGRTLPPFITQLTGILGQVGQIASAVPFVAVLTVAGWGTAFSSAALILVEATMSEMMTRSPVSSLKSFGVMPTR